MPSEAAAAVSTIGRSRWVVASITASQGCSPLARSMSIWSTRITELRMIMPLSAMMPRIATNPIGVPVGNSANTTPIRPSGATLITRNIFWKLLQLHYQNNQHQHDHDRKDGDYRVQPLGALLDCAAGFNRVALRQFFRQLGDRRRQLPIDCLGLDARDDIRLDGDRRQQIAPPDHRWLQLVLDACNLAQRDRLSVVQRDLQVPQGLQ